MAFLTELTWLHWLILGGALLILELLGGAGYLLWLGLAALSVASLVALLPLGWVGQWLLFSILALLFTGGWWYWQRQRLQGIGSDGGRSRVNGCHNLVRLRVNNWNTAQRAR